MLFRSFQVTLPNAPQDGNTLIALISTMNNASNTVTSITQTGTTWTRATQSTNNNGATIEIWYAPGSATAGAAVTVTLSQANVKSSATVMEYNGVLSANALDQIANNSGSGTTITTGSITTTQNNELMVAAIGLQGTGTTINSFYNSFTQIANSVTPGQPGSNTNLYALESIVNTVGTYFTGGTTTTIPWAAAIASFRGTIPSGTMLTLGGSAAGNYTLTGMTGTMTVTAKSLSITAPTIASKVYDGTTTTGAVTPGTLSGLVSPETLGVTATGVYADEIGRAHV